MPTLQSFHLHEIMFRCVSREDKKNGEMVCASSPEIVQSNLGFEFMLKVNEKQST